MQKLTPEYLPVFCPLTNKRCLYVPDCIARELAPAELSKDGPTPPGEDGLALWCTYFHKMVAYIKGEDDDAQIEEEDV